MKEKQVNYREIETCEWDECGENDSVTTALNIIVLNFTINFTDLLYGVRQLWC